MELTDGIERCSIKIPFSVWGMMAVKYIKNSHRFYWKVHMIHMHFLFIKPFRHRSSSLDGIDGFMNNKISLKTSSSMIGVLFFFVVFNFFSAMLLDWLIHAKQCLLLILKYTEIQSFAVSSLQVINVILVQITNLYRMISKDSKHDHRPKSQTGTFLFIKPLYLCFKNTYKSWEWHKKITS